MISIHTFELRLEPDKDTYNRLLSRAYKRSKGHHRLGMSNKHTKNDVRVDAAFAEEGITIEYHNCKFRKIIKLRVNPSEVLGGDDLDLWKPEKENTKNLIKRLNALIDDYFDSEYDLNDLELSRAEFTSNLNVGRKRVPEYIRVLHKIGKVGSFNLKYSKADYSNGKIDKDLSFDLESKRYGIAFTAYDKEEDLRKRKKKEKAEKAKGVLRIEVRLEKKKTVHAVLEAYSDKEDPTTEEQIKTMAKHSLEIFMSTFAQIVPNGTFYRIGEAENWVSASDFNKKKKEKMMQLMRLIPKKKTLHQALKELNERKVYAVLQWFAKIDVSPVTISQRSKFDTLENLYALL